MPPTCHQHHDNTAKREKTYPMEHILRRITPKREMVRESKKERERESGKNSSKDDRRRFFYLSVHIASTFKPIVSQRWPYRMTNKSFRIAIFYVRRAKEKDAWRRLRHLRCCGSQQNTMKTFFVACFSSKKTTIILKNDVYSEFFSHLRNVYI